MTYFAVTNDVGLILAVLVNDLELTMHLHIAQEVARLFARSTGERTFVHSCVTTGPVPTVGQSMSMTGRTAVVEYRGEGA